MILFNVTAQPQLGDSQPKATLKRKLAWGFLDQLFSSATNFGLSLLGGRLLGVSGLGIIVIGFSAYLIVLSFQRALLSEPLIIISSANDPEIRRRGTRSSISATVGLGLTAAAIFALLGLSLGGEIGLGLLCFAPWLLPALLQDLWRTILFRDGRGGSAAVNDAIWVVTMFACLPITQSFKEEWAVVACWGLGSLAGAILGFGQVRSGAADPRITWAWFRQAWSIGRWLAAENSVYTVASQIVIFVLVGLIGAAAVGGLRAAQSIFAPLSILWPAIALPGLPLIKNAIEESHAAARALSLKLSIVLLLLTGAYLVAASLNRGALLTGVFGEGFARYAGLIWPVGIHQLMTAAAGGHSLLLKALRMGKWILLSRTFTSIVTLVTLVPLSLRFGIVGGGWAMALGTSVGTISIIVFASHPNLARKGEAP
jgi:O-antigen/teichoic acid export membrane protein